MATTPRLSVEGLLVPGKRSQRKLSLAVTAGQSAEDGDYVALRHIREKRPKISTPRKVEEIGGSEYSGAESSPEAGHEERKRKAEARRNYIFEAIKSNSVETFKSATHNVDLLDPNLCEEVSCKNALHFALDNGCIEIAEYLIKTAPQELLCADMYITYLGIPAKKTTLQQVTWLKNVELASLLLDRVKDNQTRRNFMIQETPIEITGQRPRTLSALHMAAFRGCSDMVQLFLDHKIDVNLLNAKRDTPLLWASRWGHKHTVSMLLANGADPNQENDKGSTALYWAVRYGHYSTAKLLITKGGADVNKTREIGLVAPIILASALGNNEMVNLLLDNGADPNHAIRAQERPLHHAAREGHLDVVETLLDRGADINNQNERGETALLEAAIKDQADVVELLLRSGADIAQKNHEGVDAWTAAIESPGNKVLKVLSAHAKTCDFKSKIVPPLCIAANAGMIDKIEAILDLGVNPRDTDEEGNNFIHYAAISNYHEIIDKFYKNIDINAPNRSGDTALHLACFFGHRESIESLSNAKAKADIQNSRGETALHVAAKSKTITPTSVETLIKHIIKTHAWMSLHVADSEGQNALHVAGKHASPTVMWEFRFVRLKDHDNHGDTPLHDAVRPGEPEALNTMLDIYETMKRDADINTQNAPKHTVLHLAALEGFDTAIERLILYGADLSLQDSKGDTVLHRLTKASVTDMQHSERHLNTIDVILKQVVRWHCIRKKTPYPEVNKSMYYKYKKEAVLYLIHDITNKQHLSVVSLAFQTGAHSVLARLLMMNMVTKFTNADDDTVLFDVSRLTPKTSHSPGGCCGRGKVTPVLSSLEYIVQSDSPHRAAEVLDIPPMREIERMYESVCRRTFAFLMILHIIYMSLFTYVGITLQDKQRISQKYSLDAPTIVMFVVIPIEPFILTIYLIYGLVTHVISYGCNAPRMVSSSSPTDIILTIAGAIATISYSILVITWIILYSTSANYQDYILAIDLLTGWIASIFLTRGFKGINYFWKMLQNIIVRDIYRFLVVYLFVVLAFSFAFHVLFQISQTIIAAYPTAGDTFFLVFNMMVGMGELFDGTIATGMGEVGRSPTFLKIIYLIYIVLSTVILLNLLIAMMNDSYSSILASHRVSWRLDSVNLGMMIDKLFPFMTNVLGSSQFKVEMEKDSENVEKIHYYIIIKQQRLAKLESYRQKLGTDVLATLKPQMDAIEERVQRTEKQMVDDVADLKSQLNDMSQLLHGISEELKRKEKKKERKRSKQADSTQPA